MKRKLLLTASLLAAALGLAGCTGSEDTVGDVSLGIFTLKDIKIEHFVDPKVPGVTCHVASIEDRPLEVGRGGLREVQEHFL